MEDPEKEIEGVVLSLTSALNPDIQKAAVLRYFTPDASFRHPLCTVPPSSALPPPSPGLTQSTVPRFSRNIAPARLTRASPNSRDTILRIYQWYRVLSPRLVVHVRSATYDPRRNEMWLEVVQTFHMFFSPFAPAEARLITHLILRPEDPSDAPAEPTTRPRFLIAAQEDFYHPENLMALLVPPLVPLVNILLLLGTYASILGAWFGRVLGLWSVRERSVKLQPVGEPLPAQGQEEVRALEGAGEEGK